MIGQGDLATQKVNPWCGEVPRVSKWDAQPLKFPFFRWNQPTFFWIKNISMELYWSGGALENVDEFQVGIVDQSTRRTPAILLAHYFTKLDINKERLVSLASATLSKKSHYTKCLHHATALYSDLNNMFHWANYPKIPYQFLLIHLQDVVRTTTPDSWLVVEA